VKLFLNNAGKFNLLETVSLLIAYEFRWPSLIEQSELWRILARVVAGTLTVTFRLINA